MKKLLILVAAALLSACTATSHSGTQLDANTLSHFQSGVTTYDQVVQVLGQPNHTTAMTDGTKMVMYLSTNTQREVNPFAAFAGGTAMSMAQSSVSFVFDSNDVLKYYTTAQNNF